MKGPAFRWIILLQAILLALLMSASGPVAHAWEAPLWASGLGAALAVAMAVDLLRVARRAATRWASQPAPADGESGPPAVTREDADPSGRASVVPDPRNGPVAAVPALDPSPGSARPDAPMPTAPPAGKWRALGYVRVTRGAGACEIEAHSQRIRTQCAKSQLSVVTVVHDVETPGNARSNPALDWAIERIDEGDAQTLVVPSLRHLANSVANLPPLLQWFTEPQRRLVVIDLGLDTAAEAGRIAAFALMGVGDWEHERLSVRTRQGLEAARARGAARGRAAVDDVPELRERIVRLRNQGLTLQAIADTLNADGVPTLRGGAKWRPSSVQRSLGYRRPAPQRGLSLLSPAPADTDDVATPDA